MLESALRDNLAESEEWLVAVWDTWEMWDEEDRKNKVERQRSQTSVTCPTRVVDNEGNEHMETETQQRVREEKTKDMSQQNCYVMQVVRVLQSHK